jgi:hypothetical protein
MQVLCKSTNGNAEAHCCVCGQGFVMFWERQSTTERAATLREMQQTLRNHHRNHPGKQAHPPGGFLVPEWDGRDAHSGVAVPGHAPNWAL